VTRVEPSLRVVERTAVGVCLVMAGAAALVPFGGLGAAAGVLGGGMLAGISYRGVKAGVYGVGPGGVGRLAALVKFFTRYAILAVAAYVMLARLRLPAWAVAAGASSLVIAVAIAAARAIGSVSRPGNPR
jgi:hypothetical protein